MIDVSRLFDQQLSVWSQAADNYNALHNVKTKTVDIPSQGHAGESWHVNVQFNPARIVSTGAKMDAATIKKRPCFLCEANRPAVQEGLPWGDYTILINPFPIFPRHLTIPANAHVDQTILGRVADMAKLALELPDYVVFYNGKRCGASAPDHMHFQAGNRDFLPLIDQIGPIEQILPGIGVPARPDVTPGMIIVEAETPEQAAERFDIVIELLPVPDGDAEPMINVLAYRSTNDTDASDGIVRLVIIPRKKHRPACYGHEDGHILVSPASVDLSGVLITPLEKDFEAMDAATICKLMAELCYTPEEVRALLAKA